jgi:hypothetical protein
MKTMTFRQPVLAATALLMSFTTFAQEENKFEIAPAADLVSSYVWRGVYQTGPSVQPSIALSYAGLSLTAWGSTDFSSMSDPNKGKEFDLTVGYGIGGFSIGVTDYWWAGEGKRYGNYSNSHFFEGTVGYNFGESFPLGITWSTMFAGGDKKANGDRQFSTYVEAVYAFSVLGVDVTPSIGVSPWTGMYHKEGSDGFALSTIALKASKEIKITDSFSLPVFAQCIVAPNQDNVFLVFGLSIK